MRQNAPMQQEEPTDKRRTSNARRRVSLGPHEVAPIKLVLSRFLAVLHIERALIYPSIYEVLVEVVRTVIGQYKEPSEIALYLKDLFRNRMGVLIPVTGDECFFGRVSLKAPDLDPSIVSAIDNHFLDGCQLADYIENRIGESRSLLELYEILQMAS